MMIYTYLQRMDPERLSRVLGDSQLAAELPELPLTTAAKREICPAELSRRLFGDDRGCEDINRGKARCADCARRFLRLDMPERRRGGHGSI